MGKIERAVWNEHFKILNPGEADASTVVPEEFDLTKLTDAAYMDANVGKLMTLKKVKFAARYKRMGTKSYQYESGTDRCRNRQENQQNNLVVRNSGYSKFANEVVPQGVFDITGIFTRYNNTWQIVLRNTDDLKASETGGTLEKPYTVAQALEKINAWYSRRC